MYDERMISSLVSFSNELQKALEKLLGTNGTTEICVSVTGTKQNSLLLGDNTFPFIFLFAVFVSCVHWVWGKMVS